MSDSASPQTSKQADLQRSYGSNWTKTNVMTLNEWITIAAYNIQILTYASQYHQQLLRNNIILGLLLSTASGTISAARFSITNDTLLDNILNGLFTAMSFIIAIFTGCIKVYSVQERLEEFLRIKQDWIVFSTALTSELQLPTPLRHDALYVIVKNKVKYLDLLKANPDIPAFCVARVKAEFGAAADMDATNLPKTMMSIAAMELAQFSGEEEEGGSTAPLLGKNTVSTMSMRTLEGSHAFAGTVLGTMTLGPPESARPGGAQDTVLAQNTRPSNEETKKETVGSATIKPDTPSVPITLTVPYDSASLSDES
jgi:hypothetical protein